MADFNVKALEANLDAVMVLGRHGSVDLIA
jgi:hypothetical protein